VTFRAIDSSDFELPSYIDADKVRRCVAAKVTPYWRNENYRKMCRWWLMCMPKYAAGYDYVMRLDDDSIIEEPVPDLFEWAKEKDLVYASNILHADCGLCCYGMKEFFTKHFPDNGDTIDKLFITQEVSSRLTQIHAFRSVLSITRDPIPEITEKMTVSAPIMYYNNFFITKTDFWLRQDVKDLIDAIDRDGSIFYFRWGDAPLQTLITMIVAGSHRVSRAVFKYSKRMQREAFVGDNGDIHSYMPGLYTQTSCITDNKPPPSG